MSTNKSKINKEGPEIDKQVQEPDCLEYDLNGLPVNGWGDTLNPYLYIEMIQKNMEDYGRLYIYFKKDHKDQKIEIACVKEPILPSTAREIKITASHIHGSGDSYYHGYVDIKLADRPRHEDSIFVYIDHPQAPHGGKGTIHWP